jgi:hypothetical protein
MNKPWVLSFIVFGISMPSWPDKNDGIFVNTPINRNTLHSNCDLVWEGRPCTDFFKAVLKLPEDLRSFTRVLHYNAFYVEGESSEFSADQLN